MMMLLFGNLKVQKCNIKLRSDFDIDFFWVLVIKNVQRNLKSWIYVSLVLKLNQKQ